MFTDAELHLFSCYTPVTMTKAILISDPESGAAARIAPELGFNCFFFEAVIDGHRVSVIDAPADVLKGQARPSSYGIPILFPFPNRIRSGRFEWEGTQYQIPLEEGVTNAIHGFCLDRPWRVVDQSKDSVTGRFQLSVDAPDRLAAWPTDFIIDVRYRVTENRLECQFRITNPTTKTLPWGLGTHAYFKLPFGANSSPKDCIATVPISEEWELDDQLIPTGRRLPVENSFALRNGARFGAQKLDNVFTGWQSDGGTVRTSIFDERAGIELTQVCDAEFFREMVAYTPPERDSICLEPYTCVTDAINLQPRDLNAGLQVLGPKGVAQTWCVLQVSPILV
ncbi:aldose 1-epimerase [Planctomicrobium sp. SH661]|uniref:aldose 1-epimerase n=1 Tax=Planctomicrobium sp. SH661 TaxID=3448124 RepID=UPI003F5CBA0A